MQPTIDDILVMSVSLHGFPREVVNRERGATASGRPILKQTLIWLGEWNETTRHALYGDESHPIVDSLYRQLIDMSRAPTESALIAGRGNLGTDTLPPSWPTYVAFGVTDRGRHFAANLFTMFPAFRSFKEAPDELP